MGKPKILEMQGTVLFEDKNGNNGSSLELKQSINNFTEVKIDYSYALGDYIISESKRTPISNGKNISLTCFAAHSASVQLLDMGRYLFSGTSVTRVFETRSRITEGGATAWDGTSTGFYITKITGYKN